MKFQSEKKELWRYASKNLTAPVHGTTKLQPLPHRLPHQRHPQKERLEREWQRERMAASAGCYDAYAESSTSTSTSMRPQVSTPPPPYSPVAVETDCLQTQDYRLMFRQHQTYATDGETETSLSTNDSDTGYVRRQGCNNGGYSSVNTGDIMHVDDYEKLNEESSSCSSSYQLTRDHPQRRVEQRATASQRRISSRSVMQAQNNPVPTPTPPSPPSPPSPPTAAMTSFAATAAKILRNCCGGGFGSSNSVVASHLNLSATDNNNTTTNTTSSCTKLNYENSKRTDASQSFQPELYFNALMKQLKASQITSLLKAVKSRHDQVQKVPPASGFPMTTTSSSSSNNNNTYQTNCILMRRAEILDQEPYVIVCRLFLWRDLKNSSQLKRLPVCPNERDPVYVCCNPLHWCRILETESAPPPYRSEQMMDRTEGISFQNYGNSTSFASSDADGISSIRKTNSDLYVRMSESLTTDGQGSRCTPNWCEVAYWELSQRVGERFPAETQTINIFSDKPFNTTNGPVDGMCLKDLIEKRTTPSPDDVQNTRQKIGLGVTLSQEYDGVWLFNRSNVPIFVYSPTLTESWSRVCRVEPGYCLRAFDKYRAQTLVYSDQFPGRQTGPIDKFSMRISFGKGWGYSYKRPDVTGCPCWLEVLFRPQR